MIKKYLHYKLTKIQLAYKCILCTYLFCVRNILLNISWHSSNGMQGKISCFHTASFETIVSFTYIISHKPVKQISIILFNEIVSFSNFWIDSHTNASYDNYL